MAAKRSYADGCAAAHALDLIGDRWALLVVRELLLGPKRFTDLRTGLPGAAPNVVAQRLRELEAAGVVQRRTLPPPAASKVYELTDWGLELETVVRSLGKWGARSPRMQHDAPLSVDSLALALRALFSPGRAGELAATVVLRLDGDEFRARVEDGRFHLERGRLHEERGVVGTSADATITADGNALNEIIWSGRDLDEAVRDGLVRIDGDTAVVRRFLDLFPLPEPAPVPS
ncbi:transcriptional regulator [Actinomadura sp. KC06]|uniref:winged helix-turn-helix transcriptional regulator n=1 Tax=Actinomadura sp. KC06 TaxID=2530369 RepID=UPI00104814B0|nr:winged helix-turn-helix transcriptional regulator [Actinomadura sp. KC06]TDD29486.1 transcriptional regulator [Actinomadura sp. KC06]